MILNTIKVSSTTFDTIKRQVKAEEDLIFTNTDASEIFIVPVAHSSDNKKSTTNIVVDWMKDIKGIAEKIYETAEDEEELALTQGILSYCDAVITTVSKS